MMPGHANMSPQEHHDAHVQAYYQALHEHQQHSHFCPTGIMAMLGAHVEGTIANGIASDHPEVVQAPDFLTSFGQFQAAHHIVRIDPNDVANNTSEAESNFENSSPKNR